MLSGSYEWWVGLWEYGCGEVVHLCLSETIIKLLKYPHIDMWSILRDKSVRCRKTRKGSGSYYFRSNRCYFLEK